MPVKIAIVEDNTGIRESLCVLINGSPGFQCIAAYANAESALKQMPAKWPDTLIMDINLPEMSGIECVAKLKAMRPGLQVIMLTVQLDTEAIFKSLKAGAVGYLLKHTSPAEIIAALEDVQRGGSPMTNSIARKVVHYFQQEKPAVNETENLTRRELEILNLLAKGFQYKEIADQLGINILTVRTHIHNTYEKLHVRSRTEAVVKFLNR